MPAYGAILLGEVAQHLAAIHISCNFCPRRGPRRKAARIAEPCGAHLPELADIFAKWR
jgi:hypothetical protein